jgi:hypothetical protein
VLLFIEAFGMYSDTGRKESLHLYFRKAEIKTKFKAKKNKEKL